MIYWKNQRTNETHKAPWKQFNVVVKISKFDCIPIDGSRALTAIAFFRQYWGKGDKNKSKGSTKTTRKEVNLRINKVVWMGKGTTHYIEITLP